MSNNIENNLYKPNAVQSQNNFGMVTAPASNTTPAMQGDVSIENLTKGINDSYISNRLSSFAEIDPLMQYGVAIPSWMAINLAMDKYNKLYNGEYSKTIAGRIGNFGDKVSNLIFGNPVGRFVNNSWNKTQNLFNKYIVKNSAVIRAFNETPSKPEFVMVKGQIDGLRGMILHDCTTLFDNFLEPIKSPKDFDSLGATKEQIANIEKNIAKAASETEKKLLLEVEEFRMLNPDKSARTIGAFKNTSPAQRAQLLKELKIKKLGFNSLIEYELIKDDAIKNGDKILNALKRSTNENILIRANYSNATTPKSIRGAFLGRKVHPSELYNKLLSANGTKHSTVLGKMLSKLSGIIVEGGTSRISGGKCAAAMQAYFLAEVLIRASRQEKGIDKARSFAERFAELIGFFAFISPSIILMHKIGGLSYSRMTPEQVETYRKALAEFNEKVISGVFKNKKEYKVAKKELKSLYRPSTKNPLVWLSRKVGDFVTTGLETVRPYTKHKFREVDLTVLNILKHPIQYVKDFGSRLIDMFHNPRYWMKKTLGWPIRFAIPMLIMMPFFNKLTVKGVNKAVGKPKEALLDESKYEEMLEKQKEQAEAVQQAALQQNTPAAAVPPVTQQAPVQPTVNNQQTNLLNKYTPKYQQNFNGNPEKALAEKENNAPEPPEVKPEVSQTNTDKVDTATYIPSTDGVKLKQTKEMDDKVEAALKRAEAAEKEALKSL